MNILFVRYGDFSSNSANPLVLYARELHLAGHSSAVPVAERDGQIGKFCIQTPAV